MKERRIEPTLPAALNEVRLSDVCPHCGTFSQFKLLTTSTATSLFEVGTVFSCQSCFGLLFVKWKAEMGYAVLVVSQPEYVQIAMPEADLTYVPSSVQKDFNEARKCFGAGCYNAFAAMCRRTIQSIFNDMGIQGKDKVAKQLAKFKDEYPNEDAAKILDELIVAGHDGAHPHLPDVSPERATLTLRLMNDLLDQIYNRPGRIAEVSQKRIEAIKNKSQGK